MVAQTYEAAALEADRQRRGELQDLQSQLQAARNDKAEVDRQLIEEGRRSEVLRRQVSDLKSLLDDAMQSKSNRDAAAAGIADKLQACKFELRQSHEQRLDCARKLHEAERELIHQRSATSEMEHQLVQLAQQHSALIAMMERQQREDANRAAREKVAGEATTALQQAMTIAHQPLDPYSAKRAGVDEGGGRIRNAPGAVNHDFYDSVKSLKQSLKSATVAAVRRSRLEQRTRSHDDVSATRMAARQGTYVRPNGFDRPPSPTSSILDEEVGDEGGGREGKSAPRNEVKLTPRQHHVGDEPMTDGTALDRGDANMTALSASSPSSADNSVGELSISSASEAAAVQPTAAHQYTPRARTQGVSVSTCRGGATGEAIHPTDASIASVSTSSYYGQVTPPRATPPWSSSFEGVSLPPSTSLGSVQPIESLRTIGPTATTVSSAEQTTIVNEFQNNVDRELAILRRNRDLLLTTGVYHSTDAVIQELDRKIQLKLLHRAQLASVV